jgi:IclR family mhp operon transcriptional activator
MPSFEPVSAVLRALDCLVVVNRLKEASVADIFRQTGLNRPTVVRMLETLIHAGFVVRHPARAVYLPTGRTLELSRGYQRHEEMGLVAAPILAALHQRLQWPSDVAVFDGDAMVVAQTSRSAGRLHFNRQPGYRAPLLGSSIGLAYVAFCPDAERQSGLAALRTAAEPWNAPARNPAALRRLVAKLREDGFATMHPAYSEAAYDGVASAVGVPVLIAGVAVGSLNVMYLRDAMDEPTAIGRFAAPLVQAAAEIADALSAARRMSRSPGTIHS